jgi:hypothetical protein
MINQSILSIERSISTQVDVIDTSGFYPRSNPSGFITGIENLVFVTGDQNIYGLKTFEQGLQAGLDENVSTLYVSSGAVGINNENPQASLDISGSTMFSERPTVNGTGVLLSGEVDTSNFYTNNNPSGFITGIENLFYTTGDQAISGIKTFANNVTILGDFAVSGATFINEVIDVTTTGTISGVTGVFQHLEANNLVYNKTTSSVIAQPGDDLIAKYEEAAALNPNGSAKSSTNRATLILMPGNYTFSEYYIMNVEFVDIIGLGSQTKKPSVIIQGTFDVEGDTYYHLTFNANDIRVSGLSFLEQAFYNAGNKQLQIFQNCTGGDSCFGLNVNLSGTFIDCIGGVQSFGSGGGGNASGTFINCVGGDGSFGGYGETASGIFKDCSAGNNSFGGASGGTASGIFEGCIAGSLSFGGTNGTASGTFTNCKADGGSFGGVGGTASGVFTNCIAEDSSFGSDEGTATGKFYNCRTASFGNLTAPDIGFAVQQNCSDDSGNIIEGYISLNN